MLGSDQTSAWGSSLVFLSPQASAICLAVCLTLVPGLQCAVKILHHSSTFLQKQVSPSRKLNQTVKRISGLVLLLRVAWKGFEEGGGSLHLLQGLSGVRGIDYCQGEGGWNGQG